MSDAERLAKAEGLLVAGAEGARHLTTGGRRFLLLPIETIERVLGALTDETWKLEPPQ